MPKNLEIVTKIFIKYAQNIWKFWKCSLKFENVPKYVWKWFQKLWKFSKDFENLINYKM
jgi:hypothetical protein